MKCFIKKKLNLTVVDNIYHPKCPMIKKYIISLKKIKQNTSQDNVTCNVTIKLVRIHTFGGLGVKINFLL